MPSLQTRFFSAVLRLQSVFIASYTPLAIVRRFAQSGRLPMPRDVSASEVDAGGVPAQWVIPATAIPDRVILYLHGGGYVIASPGVHRAMLGQLALAARMPALMIDYRLAPEHPFPAAVDDALAAYRWLLAEGYPPDGICVAGDSAGGGLALALCMALRDAGEPLPGKVATISAWTDLAFGGESLGTRKHADPYVKEQALRNYARLYMGDRDSRQPLGSPLYGDFKGLPPMLLLVGDNEILLSDSTRAAERARTAGVDVTMEVWPGMFHVWPILAPYLPEANAAIGRIARFFDKIA